MRVIISTLPAFKHLNKKDVIMSLSEKIKIEIRILLSGYNKVCKECNSKSIGSELLFNISNNCARCHDNRQGDNVIDDFIWRIDAIVA